MNKVKDIKGQRFGRLVALECIGRHKDGHALWVCHCDCGEDTITSTNYLKKGNTKSCGCIRRDNARKRNSDQNGSKNRNWQGGRQYARGPKHTRWAYAVKERDGYVCQICDHQGYRGDFFTHAHHILSGLEYKHLRHDIDNGVTYCWKCHMKVHRKRDED